MKIISLELTDEIADELKILPQASLNFFAENFFRAQLKGEIYPSGPEQIELAIHLLENKVDIELITALTRLSPEFIKDLV